MKELAARYPKARKIRVVQDNLNTHSTSSFYEAFSAEEAFALSQRFEFYYTPKSASWLNMIEIEFSALSKQCLNQRITTKEELTKEVLSIVKERDEKGIKIDWQFSIESARGKLNRHYRHVNADNARYQKT
jgi:transposase